MTKERKIEGRLKLDVLEPTTAPRPTEERRKQAENQLRSLAVELVEVLKEVEWYGTIRDEDACPYCKSVKNHDPNCHLAAVLKRAEEIL